MFFRWLLKLGIIIAVLSIEIRAIPIPALDLTELTHSADVIVVGRIGTITEEGPTNIIYNEQSFDARRMRANLRVQRVVKGRSSAQEISFIFNMPEIALGYGGIPNNQFGMLFLKRKADSGYVIVNPYYPFLTASQSAPVTSGTELERVILEIAQVLTAGDTSSQERLEAVKALGSVQGELVTAALRRAVTDHDPNVQAQAAATLLQHNDLFALGIAKQLLLNPPTNIAPYPLAKLALALEGIKDSRAVPVLSRLLDSDKVEVRRSAANALGNIGESIGIAPLTRALNDSDFDVRYYAVLGLARITGQDEWGPALPLFEKDEKRYLTHWRDWANQR